MSVGATVGSFPAPQTVPHTPLRIAMALPLRPRSPFALARSLAILPVVLAGFAFRRPLARSRGFVFAFLESINSKK